MRFLWAFMILTLRRPGVAARSILLRQFPNEAIWTGLFLAVILNALFFGILGLVIPNSKELAMFDMSSESPGLSMMVSAVRSVLFAALLTLGGSWLGGTGRFMSILSLLVWDQLVQLALMSLGIVVLLISPQLGSMVFLVIGLVLLFVLLNFINEAHGFASLWRSFAVVLMASIVMFFAMIFIVGLLGPANLGLLENV
ncbi:YIP1 family protein [Pseudophaeobacter sp.]|uniref:YIP1 family protein n=1 Tax=Pseudophaeobacter sp. TaxID=1971739 RepID=UPI003297187E